MFWYSAWLDVTGMAPPIQFGCVDIGAPHSNRVLELEIDGYDDVEDVVVGGVSASRIGKCRWLIGNPPGSVADVVLSGQSRPNKSRVEIWLHSK